MADYPVYFTYIVKCADGTLYTGKTFDLVKRVKQHNGELSGGARYTKTRRPVTLKYFEEYNSNKLAVRREYQLKQLSHKEKEKLCNDKD